MKNAVIISGNNVIYDAIQDNSEHELILINSEYKSCIESLGHVDLLILDKEISPNDLPLYRINLLANFTKKSISEHEIFLRKPCKLQELLNIFTSAIQDISIFCCLNKEWVYNQRNATLTSNKQRIFFTDKENTLFAELFKADAFTLDKQELKSTVWQYHQDSESTTVDTHLYKLKQKLPKNLLEIEGAKCFLNISVC